MGPDKNTQTLTQNNSLITISVFYLFSKAIPIHCIRDTIQL